jgi:putative ABC transport system permease protein
MILDLRYVWRRIAGARGFSTVIVLTLSVGIGAATAIFSLVHAILLEPLPYPDPDRLVRIVETLTPGENPLGRSEDRITMEAQRLAQWRGLTSTLADVGGYLTASATIATAEGAMRVPIARVSPVIFSMLGARIHLGRALLDAEDRPDSRVAILSYAAWRAYFGGSPDVIGRSVSLDGEKYTIVGVTTGEFSFPSSETQFWVPLGLAGEDSGDTRSVNVLARVRQQVSLSDASVEADLIGRRLSGEAESSRAAPSSSRRFRIEQLQRQMTRAIAPSLHMFTAAAVSIMCIVTANVVTLLLSRGTRHRQEAVIHAPWARLVVALHGRSSRRSWSSDCSAPELASHSHS